MRATNIHLHASCPLTASFWHAFKCKKISLIMQRSLAILTLYYTSWLNGFFSASHFSTSIWILWDNMPSLSHKRVKTAHNKVLESWLQLIIKDGGISYSMVAYATLRYTASSPGRVEWDNLNNRENLIAMISYVKGHSPAFSNWARRNFAFFMRSDQLDLGSESARQSLLIHETPSRNICTSGAARSQIVTPFIRATQK